MKNIKASWILAVLTIMLLMPTAMAILDADTTLINITINYPTDKLYNASGGSGIGSVPLLFNVTVKWMGTIGAIPGMNITNVSIVFRDNSDRNQTFFVNDTINGSKVDTTLGQTLADWKMNISANRLREGVYTVYAIAYNESTSGNDSSEINSSTITFTIDRSIPSAKITTPPSGSTVVPNNNIVTFDYTPTDLNFGNCTFYFNNVASHSTTSGTTTPNVTSGATNRFTKRFGGDNETVRVAVWCIDLAGLATASSSQNNFTFNVLTGGVSPAIKAMQGSGGGIQVQKSQPASKGFTISPPSVSSTHLEKYGWAYFIAIIIIGFFGIKKLLKK